MTDRLVENALNAIRARAQMIHESGARQADVHALNVHGNNESAAAAAPLAHAGSLSDQLPPLTSKRRGAVGRLEVSLKRFIKRATHWYTWGQVGFNLSIHAALREMLAAFMAHGDRVEQLRDEILSEVRAELTTLANAQASQMLRSESVSGTLERLTAEAGRLATEVGLLKTELAQVAVGYEQGLQEIAAGYEQALAQVSAGYRQVLAMNTERDAAGHALVAHLQEEQRVLFKQLSLAASEQAVLADRAQRRAEAAIRDLAERLAAQRDGHAASDVRESVTQ